MPRGDKRFGLKSGMGAGGEFDPAVGFQLLFVGVSPLPVIAIGARFNWSFGPLNTTGWQEQVGFDVGFSSLLQLAPTIVIQTPVFNRMQLYAAVDAGIVGMFTDGSDTHEFCDNDGCIEVEEDKFDVQYWGFGVAGAAGFRYLSRVEANGSRSFVNFEMRYLSTNWRGASVGFDDSRTDMQGDVSTMQLDHLAFSIGLGGGW